MSSLANEFDWAANDIDAAMACVAEDAVYALYISGELLPAGGETVGRDNIAAALRKIRECFDYLLCRPLHVQAKDDVVRFQVEFMYRHRQSGETLSGRFRMVMRVNDGLLIRADASDIGTIRYPFRAYSSPLPWGGDHARDRCWHCSVLAILVFHNR